MLPKDFLENIKQFAQKKAIPPTPVDLSKFDPFTKPAAPEGYKKTVEAVIEKAPKAAQAIISPFSTFVTPALKEIGVPGATAIGIIGDIMIVPGGGGKTVPSLPNTLRTVVKYGGKITEMKVADVMKRVKDIGIKLAEQRSVRKKAVTKHIENLRDEQLFIRQQMSEALDYGQKALKAEAKEVADKMNTTIRTILPPFTRGMDALVGFRDSTKTAKAGVAAIREMQTGIDTILTEAKNLRQSPELLNMTELLRNVRQQLGRIPQEAIDVGKQMRELIAEQKMLTQAMKNRYDVEDLRNSIKQLGLKQSEEISTPWWRKLELIGREMFLPSETGLKHLGKAGRNLYRRYQSITDLGQRRFGEFFADYLRLARGLNKEETERIIFDALEGKALPKTKAGMEMVNFLREEFKKVITSAKEAGVQARMASGEKTLVRERQAFAPHILDFEKIATPEGQALVIEHLIRTGQTKNIEKAKALLSETQVKIWQKLPDIERAKLMVNGFIEKQRTGGAFFGNLSRVRTLDLPSDVLVTGLDQIVGKYFQNVYHFLEQTRQFGQANERIAPLLKEIGRTQGKQTYAFAERFVRLFTNGVVEESLSERLVRGIKSYEVASKLGLAVIPNLGQSAFSMVKTGVRNTLDGIAHIGKAEAQEFALRVGATTETVLRKMLADLGAGKAGEFILSKTGFSFVEKSINRTVAPWAAKGYLNDLYRILKKNPLNKDALRELEQMRIDPKAFLKFGPRLDRFQKQAGLRITKLTQFTGELGANPLLMNHPNPWIRLIYQFKQFPLQAARFGVNELIIRAKNNPRPLIRYLAISPIGGEIVNDVIATLRGNKRTDSPAERLLENMVYIGALGMITDLIRSSAYGKGSILGSFFGPFFSDVGTAVEATYGAGEGRPQQLARFGLRSIPIVGSQIQKGLFPTKEQKAEKKARGEGFFQPFTSLVDTLENISEGKFKTEPFVGRPKKRKFRNIGS